MAELRFGYLSANLRAKFAVGIALPLLLIMSSVAVAHYWQERRLLEDQILAQLVAVR